MALDLSQYANVSDPRRRTAQTFNMGNLWIDQEGGYSRDADGQRYWDPEGTAIQNSFYMGGAPGGGRKLMRLDDLPADAARDYLASGKVFDLNGMKFMFEDDAKPIFNKKHQKDGIGTFMEGFASNLPYTLAGGLATMGLTGMLPTSGFEGMGTFGNSVAGMGGNIFTGAPNIANAGGNAISASDAQLLDNAIQTQGMGGSESLLGSQQAIDGSMQTIFDGSKSIWDQIVESPFGQGLKSVIGSFAPGGAGTGPGSAKSLGLMDVAAGIWQYLQQKDNAGNIQDATNAGIARTDPFGPERAFYQGELRKLFTDPDYLQSTPGYQAGIQQVNRRNAKLGQMFSGQNAIDNINFGTDQQLKLAGPLLQAAGAGITPGYAGYLGQQGAQLANQANTAGSGALMTAGKGLWDIFKGVV